MITLQPSRKMNDAQKRQTDRKFGMFIHFGINTFASVEWSEGDLPISLYNPTSLNCDDWVKTAYEAGMNYVILITKHHDGFCLWDTKTTKYSVNYAQNTTDIVKEVSEACKKYGIAFGLYYSLWDRNSTEYKDYFENQYIPMMFEQLRELTDGRYGDIAELWLDGSWDKACSEWHFEELYDLVKRNQPYCQIGINHTVGEYSDKSGFPSEEYIPEKCKEGYPLRMFPSDFRLWDPYPCSENDPKIYTFNGEKYYLPFEMTICSREGFSWFNSDTYEEKPLMDIDETVKMCKRAFSQQNNAVINLPPDINGELSKKDVEHLKEISKNLGILRTV